MTRSLRDLVLYFILKILDTYLAINLYIDVPNMVELCNIKVRPRCNQASTIPAFSIHGICNPNTHNVGLHTGASERVK